MADYFADAYFGSKYWTASYFQGGEADPNAISASLSGSGAITATLTAAEVVVSFQGGGWLSKEQLREYQKTRKRKKLALDELEKTVERAFGIVDGIEPEPIAEKPQKVVVQAREIVRVLVARKANKVASVEEAALLKELKRLTDLVIADICKRELEEEEAIVLLLAA